MALTGTFVYNGYSVPGAYVVARAQSLVAKNETVVCAEVYPSQEARYSWPQPMFTVGGGFALDLAGGNIYEQSYAYLLTRPEFAGFQPA